MNGVRQFIKNSFAELVYLIVKMGKQIFMMPEGTCRFKPTCSQYSREALKKLPLHKAIPKIINRISRCHPNGDSGDDPVIPKKEK